MKTVNLNLNVPNFDTAPWHDQVNDNFKSLDAIISTTFGITNVKGVYQNSTAVVAGERYIDISTGEMYEVVANYVTDPAPTTFANDRLAHPSNWLLIDASAALNGLAQMLSIRNEVFSARDDVDADKVAVEALLSTLSVSALATIGGTPKTITDWDNAKNFPNTVIYADAAASLLPSGFEFGVVGSPGRAGLGFYYSLDANNGFISIIALASGNRWDRRYESGVWQGWSRPANRNEVVRRDYQLTGDVRNIVNTATVVGADVYRVAAGFSNLPSWGAIGDFVLAFITDTNNGVLYCIGKSGNIATRAKVGGVWNNWIEYKTPTEITTEINSAVGVKVNRNATFNGDLDALISNTGSVGFDVYTLKAGFTNGPSAATVDDVLISKQIDQNNGFQQLILKSNRTFSRAKISGVWQSWRDTITNIVESGQLAYTNNGAVILNHGFGVSPKFVDFEMVCVTASGEGAVGDRYKPMHGVIALTFDATLVSIRIVNTGITKIAAGGAVLTLTPANWRFVIRAGL